MVGQFFLPVCWTFARRRDGRGGHPTDVRGLLGALAGLRGWGRAFKLQNWHGGWEVLAGWLTANFEIGTPDPRRFWATSGSFASFTMARRRSFESSIGWRSNGSGMAGRCLKDQGSDFPSAVIGIFNSTRWPRANVMMAFSFSKWSPSLWNLPNPGARDSALARSLATLGFSAMMRDLDMVRARG